MEERNLKDNIEHFERQGNSDIDIPENPGPAILGNTPIVGTLRRENDMPVLRDELDEL